MTTRTPDDQGKDARASGPSHTDLPGEVGAFDGSCSSPGNPPTGPAVDPNCHRYCEALHEGKPHDPYYLGMANTVLTTLWDLPAYERLDAVRLRIVERHTGDGEVETHVIDRGDVRRA